MGIMITNLFTIYDNKAAIYNTPFSQNNNAEAMRTFADMANDEKTTISKHPDDYDLYKIGEWNSNNGEVVGTDKTHLANGQDFIQNNEQ